ncbi:P-loop containing nucleoside triphosphate hydrolase protein [Gongronella butleri]|nr:P-loop containing nucleoside triphosphate hydrolase protein [Gongronella butleri]
MKRRAQQDSDDIRYLPSGETYRVAPKPKPWDLKAVISHKDTRDKALQSARAFIKVCGAVPMEQSTGRPWHEQVDDLFFSRRRRGLVSWWLPTGSALYYEFEGFYRRVCDGIDKRGAGSSDGDAVATSRRIERQSELLRHTLVLFHDFVGKRRLAQQAKIKETRASLPITPYANAIVHTLRNDRLLLIAGDTGCGKSTQVPQILMAAGFRKIACTQPRRIACSSLSRRVSYETMNEYGSEIAYQVRFEGTKTNRTRILFLTEGLLLRQYAADSRLSMYDVIVVDEVHERHMATDFLLALLKRLMKERDDLYLVLMSATINAKLFAEYFDAPSLVVPGKMYDVKVHYWNGGRDDARLTDAAAFESRQNAQIKASIASRSARIDAAPYIKVMQHIDDSVPSHERGDLLIFVSGINEITALEDELGAYADATRKWVVLILHSSVAMDDQDKIFDAAPEGIRKCIISSNIAETSVTIDGIRFIVDSGKVKESSHDAISNMQRLSKFWISKASAKQRAGRAGRTGPGECFRLYSENEYNHLNDYSVPEIQRAALEPIVLNIKAMGLGDPREFDFIQPPPLASIEASLVLLQNLGALDQDEEITALGQVLANLPVDAVIGKMLLLGLVFRVMDAMLTMVACMSVQSPFVRLHAGRSGGDDVAKKQRTFHSPHGDPFTLLNAWQAWIHTKVHSKESSRRWCRAHGLEEQRLYEITKIRGQFEKILQDFDPGAAMDDEMTQQDHDDAAKAEKGRQREMLKRGRFDHRHKKQQRVLSTGQAEYDGDHDDNNDGVDLRSIEFSLKNNLRRLERRARALDNDTVLVLKLILCSALYPQFAMGDSHNPYRKSDELVFHAPVASFLSLHPSSALAHHPDWVRELGENVRRDDLAVEEGIQHQLLCYLQLLETNKPYLLNLTRVPGVHMLLLFSKHLDTNRDCTVMVADAFYVLQFKTAEVAQCVLKRACQLRSAWERLFDKRLGKNQGKADDDNEKTTVLVSESVRYHLPIAIQDILDVEETPMDKVHLWTPQVQAAFDANVKQLLDDMNDFLNTSISVELTIGTASKMMAMYTKWKKRPEDQGMPRSWQPNQVLRQGVQITPHLVYDCLRAESCASAIPMDQQEINKIPGSMRMFWYCARCENTLTLRKQDLLEHVANCDG